MKLRACALACFALTVILPVRADQGARGVIQHAYDSSNQAAARKDLAGVFSIDAPAYLATDKRGHRASLTDERQQVRGIFQVSKSLTVHTNITSFQQHGPSATVRVANLVDLTTSKGTRMELRETSEDAWTLGKQGWKREKSTTLTTGPNRINGKLQKS